MTPLPKRKLSTRRQGKRRAAIKVAASSFYPCSNCGKPKKPHQACKHCGVYKKSTKTG